MKVTFVADEYFNWGQHGGYGAFTRKLGSELVKQGIEVEALVHKIMPDQKPVGKYENVDGVNVVTLPREKMDKLKMTKLYTRDTDIIHSQCGRLDTYFTCKHNGDKPRVVTIQDYRTKQELKQIGDAEPMGSVKQLWNRTADFLYKRALHKANVVAVQADLLKPKVAKAYGLKESKLLSLPNFVDVPEESTLQKSDAPTVIWLGRLDPIKNPELCFELARQTPNVEFYILGEAHNKQRDVMLREKYGNISNLHLVGFCDGKLKQQLLSRAWILINTSIYECLPVSFLEAMANKCALISTQNPDDYTNKYGYYATPDKLKEGLDYLLKGNRWMQLGSDGYQHAKLHHSTEKGIQNHLQLYRKLLS